MNGELFDRESLANIALFMRVAVQAAVCAKEMGMVSLLLTINPLDCE